MKKFSRYLPSGGSEREDYILEYLTAQSFSTLGKLLTNFVLQVFN